MPVRKDGFLADLRRRHRLRGKVEPDPSPNLADFSESADSVVARTKKLLKDRIGRDALWIARRKKKQP
jgi:hypothetical protein